MRVAFAAALIAVVAACARKAPVVQATPMTPTPITQSVDFKSLAQAAGSYTLKSVDGHELPFAPVHPGAPAGAVAPEILSSSLLLRADGTFAMDMNYRTTNNGTERTFGKSFTGTYVADGSGAFRLSWDGAGQNVVNVSGDKAVMDNEGMQFTFERLR